MLNLYPDFRVEGKPKFILADKPPKLMLITDEVRKCVVYVGYRLPNGEIDLQGTAFFVSRSIPETDQAFLYLVTAAHLIQGISSLENFDGKILLRANFTNGNAETIETNIENWKFHPDESEVDVAVLPHLKIDDKAIDYAAIPIEMFLDDSSPEKQWVFIGNEVFLTGLFFNHHGRKRNIPIVRVGNIVALPEEKVLTRRGFIDAYLVESRSIGGLSGSPVFVYFESEKQISYGISISGFEPFYLLGLMHGHYQVDVTDDAEMDALTAAKEAINMGIAIIVPANKILEVINQPEISEAEEQYKKQVYERLLPTIDNVSEENPNKEPENII